MFWWIWRSLTQPSRRHAFGLIGMATAIMVFGGIGFSVAEHIGIADGMYWAVVTASTVGYGDITPHTHAGHIIACVVMLTTIPLLGAVFAVWSGAAASARVRRLLHMGRAFPEGSFSLVVGMHPVVPAMLDELVATGHDVVLVADVDPVTVRDDVHHVRGDPTSLQALKTSRPEKAEQALVTGASDGDVMIAVVLLRECAPDLDVTALVHSATAEQALKDLGVSRCVSTDLLLSHTLAKVLEAPHAGALLLELLDSDDHCLDEFEATAEMAGRQLSAVRSERGDLVLGLVHDGKVSLGIGVDPVLAVGDRLLVARPA